MESCNPNIADLFPEGFTPEAIFPFESYRTPRPDGKGFLRSPVERPASIAHFMFSERFRGSAEEDRLAVLGLPSVSEARKFVAHCDENPAWIAKQDAMVRMAIWKQFCALPYLPARLYKERLLIGSAAALGKGWGERHGGRERWKGAVIEVTQSFLRRSERMSLLPTGDTDIFNPFLVSSKIAALLGSKTPHEVLIACRRGVDATAELWAMNAYYPAIHIPLRTTPAGPVRDDSIKELAAHATHAILFTKSTSLYGRTLAKELTANSIPLRLVALDDHGRPIPKAKAPASRAPARR